MKQIPILIIIVFLIAFLSCEQENTNPSVSNPIVVELDTFIVNNYIEDAKSLYFHEIITDIYHPNYNNPIIDTAEVTKVLKIIQAVYNLNSPERDTIFDIHEIHGHFCYSFQSISLNVKTELPEIQNLSNNIIPTGDSGLDHLLSTYKFDSVKTSYSYPSFSMVDNLYSRRI